MKERLLEEIQKGSKGAVMKKHIITYLIYNENSTITDLAKDMDLSIPTVTKIIDEMHEQGYIDEYGKLETNGGRHPILYGLNTDSGYFVGVDVTWNSINIGIINFKGEVLKLQMGIPFERRDTLECIDELCNHIEHFIAGLTIDEKKILHINVTLCGRVNPELGYSHSFFNFGERPLAEILTERLKIETSIDNDSRTMLYGENIKGVVKGAKNVLFINIGWGLGMGIMIDGKLYKGKSGFSGEIGHTYGYDNQIICHCGKKGCVETEVSCSALYRKFIEHLQAGETSIILSEKDIEEITLDDIFSAINREDLLAIELVEQIGQQLGFHIGSLINTFNPDMVIIGGEMSRAGDFLLQPVISAIRKYTLSLMSRDSEIVLSKLKDQACVIGSCLLSGHSVNSIKLAN